MMKRGVYCIAVVYALLAVTQAQNPVTLYAPNGSVNPQSAGTLDFNGGGNAYVGASLSGCYFNNNPCYFARGEVSYYNIPEYPAATLTIFAGVLQPQGNNVYTVSGAASGVDNAGNTVNVSNVQFTFHVSCRSGRGGGCTKRYLSGSMTFTVTP